jgi:hypothetical protein
MIRPINEQEITLGTLCDECGEPTTHCETETTDYPLFLCTAHALNYAIRHGGSVRRNALADKGNRFGPE